MRQYLAPLSSKDIAANFVINIVRQPQIPARLRVTPKTDQMFAEDVPWFSSGARYPFMGPRGYVERSVGAAWHIWTPSSYREWVVIHCNHGPCSLGVGLRPANWWEDQMNPPPSVVVKV